MLERLPRRLGQAAALAVAAAFLALIAYGLIARAPNTSIDERLARGDAAPAPPFRLPILDPGDLRVHRGGSLGDRELRGRPYLINLWASWCDPCRAEMPLLARTWAGHRRPRVLFVGLDQQDVISDARAFLRHFGVRYPTIRDPGDTIARRYGATGVPETYFVNARGEIVDHVIGALSASQLARGLRAADRGAPVAAARGGARSPLR